MRRSRLPSVARQLLAEIPDADLLERYVLHGADDAFAQLVTRYSRLVWGQCRNLLPGDADADDAFQATFLTLARSAKSIRAGAPLGPWLHGVAFRVCQNARRAIQRRAKREKACAIPEADRPIADSTWEAAFAAVSEEVQKLPEAQRTAFVLCCIEGRATTEAAASLGQKLGTFSARLTRAKQTLLDRLAKRGLGAAVLALGGITGSVSVAPAALVERTLTLIPPGVIVPSSVNALMHGVTGMMMFRFKLLAAGVMVATGLGLSVGAGWSNSATAQVPGAPSATKVAPPKGDGAIEKLKAELERAKAELAKAEAEMVKDGLKLEAVQLALELKGAKMAPKFEYERMPEQGMREKEFEEKLAEREKNGWEFLGQVNVYTSDRGNVTPKLVFRKGGMRSVILREELRELSPKIVPPVPPIAPSPPKAPKPPVSTIPSPMEKPSAAVTPVEGVSLLSRVNGVLNPTLSKSEPRPTPGYSIREVEVVERKLQELWYQERIAELEKQVAALGGKPAMAHDPWGFNANDYGNWDPKDLVEVLRKVMADDVKAKKYVGAIVFASEKEHFKVTGSPEALAAVAEWVKKLKK